MDAVGRKQWETPSQAGYPQLYRMLFPTAVGLQDLPVEGYCGRVATNTAIIVYFLHRQVRDILVILDEGNLSHPRLPRCDIMVPWVALNGQHTNTTKCAREAEQKWHRMASEEMRDSTLR